MALTECVREKAAYFPLACLSPTLVSVKHQSSNKMEQIKYLYDSKCIGIVKRLHPPQLRIQGSTMKLLPFARNECSYCCLQTPASTLMIEL